MNRSCLQKTWSSRTPQPSCQRRQKRIRLHQWTWWQFPSCRRHWRCVKTAQLFCRTFMPTTSQGLWWEETYTAVAPYNDTLATKMEKVQESMPMESFSQSYNVARPSQLSTTHAHDPHYQPRSSSTACSSTTDTGTETDWLGLCDCSVTLIRLALFVMWL